MSTGPGGGKVKLYAELPAARARQIISDVVALLAVVLSVRVGVWLHRLAAKLAVPGQAIQDAGESVAGSLDRAAEAVGQVPVGGRGLRAPFSAAAEAGRVLAEAGQAQQQAALGFALLLGALVAVLGVLMVVVAYGPRRLGWVREASAAARLRDTSADLRVFAYRAVAARPLSLLRRAVPDPGAALVAEEFDALAAVELEALGLRQRS